MHKNKSKVRNFLFFQQIAMEFDQHDPNIADVIRDRILDPLWYAFSTEEREWVKNNNIKFINNEIIIVDKFFKMLLKIE